MIESIGLFFNNLAWVLIVPGILLGILMMLAGKLLPTAFMQYKVIAQVLGIILVVFFTFQSGRHNEYEKWQVKIAADQVRIAQLETESQKVNTEIVTKYITKTKVVEKWREIKVDRYIPAAADKVCKIDEIAPQFRGLVNAAAKGVDPTEATP